MFADNIVRNNKSKYWTEIQHPIELRHGDLITYTTTGPRQNHCMLVNHLIRTEKDRATVQVIDSTQHPHINDTRRHDQTGIGMGEIILYKINNQWREYRHNIYTYQGTITMMRIK